MVPFLKGLDLRYRNGRGLKTSPLMKFGIVIVGSDNFCVVYKRQCVKDVSFIELRHADCRVRQFSCRSETLILKIVILERNRKGDRDK